MKKPISIILAISLIAFILPKLSIVSSDMFSGSSPQLEKELNLLKNKINQLEKGQTEKNQAQQSVTESEDSLSKRRNSKKSKNQIITRVTWEPDGSHLDDPFIGDGNVLMMGFIDHLCEPCKKFYTETFSRLKDNYFTSHVKFILRDFPLKSNNMSRKASQAAHCAGEQGQYWQMSEALISVAEISSNDDFEALDSGISGIEGDLFRGCLNSKRYRGEIDRDLAEGGRLGAKGAPGFFIGKSTSTSQYEGVFVRGAQPYKAFARLLDKQLEQ